jgi:hypothetical protein
MMQRYFTASNCKKAIKEKIFSKFNVSNEEKASHAIFAVDSGNTENQGMSIVPYSSD